jgi:hypothetical protein
MVKFDVQKIDDEIRALEDLKRFMSNPATAAILQRFTTSNGRRNGASHLTRQIARLPLGQRPQRGALVAAAKTACREFSVGVEFTAKEVLAKMEAQGYIFQAQNRDIAVNSALKRLVKKGSIEQTHKAVGHRPAKYRIPVRSPRD